MAFYSRRPVELVGVTSREIAHLEFERLATLAWPIFTAIFCFEALVAEPQLKSWQIIFVVGTLSCLLVSVLLARFLGSLIGFSPLALELLFAPILLGDRPSHAFFSFGLLTIAINVFLSGWDLPKIAIPLMICVTALQIWVIHQDFSAINDGADLKLLGTYFSTAWTLGLGIGSAYLRARYLKYSEEIDEIFESSREEANRKLAGINRLNQSDYRNLQLHGTLLNTLIAIRQNKNLLNDRASIINYLRKDIAQIKEIKSSNHLSLELSLTKIAHDLSSGHFIVSFTPGNFYKLNDLQINQLLEIARELILNAKKHSRATIINITYETDDDGVFHLRMISNVLGLINRELHETELSKSGNSRTLLRLLDSAEGKLNLSIESERNLIFEITFGADLSAESSIEKLVSLRLESLTWLSRGFLLFTYLYSLVCVVGYLFISIEEVALIASAVQAILMSVIFFRPHARRWELNVARILTLTIFPLTLFGGPQCAELRYTPWLYNALLGSCFYLALQARSRVSRWLPLAIFFIETLGIGFFYPQGCRDILNGSIPGVPLMVLFVVAVSKLRRRSIETDKAELYSIIASEADYSESRELIDRSIAEIIADTESLILNLERKEFLPVEVESGISQLNREIRVYLVLSEYFAASIIRELYRVLRKQRIAVSVVGQNFSFIDSSDPVVPAIQNLISHGNSEEIELVISSANTLSLELKGRELTDLLKENFVRDSEGSVFAISFQQ